MYVFFVFDVLAGDSAVVPQALKALHSTAMETFKSRERAVQAIMSGALPSSPLGLAKGTEQTSSGTSPLPSHDGNGPLPVLKLLQVQRRHSLLFLSVLPFWPPRSTTVSKYAQRKYRVLCLLYSFNNLSHTLLFRQAEKALAASVQKRLAQQVREVSRKEKDVLLLLQRDQTVANEIDTYVRR